MNNYRSTGNSCLLNKIHSRTTPCLIVMLFANCGVSVAGELFDMDAIRNPKTLEVEVLQE